jgi:hypothetical protein
MTYAEVRNLLDDLSAELGIPYEYQSYRKGTAPDPPYFLFTYPASGDLIADNRNYAMFRTLDIELYTLKKNFAMEMKLEKFLQDHDMPYSLLADEWLESEGMHETLYETGVNITEESEEA